MAEHTTFWEALGTFIALQHDLELTALEKFHADELTAMETAHTVQLEALLTSLEERRVVLVDAHAVELADLQASPRRRAGRNREPLGEGEAGGGRRDCGH